jgi:hypothetical protein
LRLADSIDYALGRIYLDDNQTDYKVEVTVAFLAFESTAHNVLFRNISVENHASVAQKIEIIP